MGVDRETFRRLIEPLCDMYRVTFDVAHWTVYYQALSDVSPQLLEAGVVLASRSPESFMPRPGELRAYAEQARLARIAERPWRHCDDCASLKGYVEITDAHGVRRLTKCGCYFEHRQRLAADGVPWLSLLDAPRVEREDAAAWAEIQTGPDPRQFPREITMPVKSIAAGHNMRTVLSRESSDKAGRSVDLTPQTDPDGHPLPEWPLRRS